MIKILLFTTYSIFGMNIQITKINNNSPYYLLKIISKQNPNVLAVMDQFCIHPPNQYCRGGVILLASLMAK